MIKYTMHHIAGILNSNVQGAAANAVISTLVTDSRKIHQPAGSLFFAINGERRNGNQFIADCYRQGIRCFVTDNEMKPDEYPGSTFIVVSDTIAALQELAAFHRLQFNIPVIGITG